VGAPVFDPNIDDAVVFDCASQASTDAGCTTTVTSPIASGDYQVTIWYPCAALAADASANANCCFLPAVGYPTPFDAWCVSTGAESFIITQPIELYPAVTSLPDGGSSLPP
jgi:hypothetical protein